MFNDSGLSILTELLEFWEHDVIYDLSTHRKYLRYDLMRHKLMMNEWLMNEWLMRVRISFMYQWCNQCTNLYAVSCMNVLE
jgi:hypothetical protein